MRTDEATMETIATFCQQMKANNWQERQAGIAEMVTMVESRPAAVCSNITKVHFCLFSRILFQLLVVFQIFDSFIPCLKDSNSKTNLYALQMMIHLTPPLSDNLGSVVNMLVQNVSANLSSKNKDIYDTASQALDVLMEHIGTLLQLVSVALKYTDCISRCSTVDTTHGATSTIGKCTDQA
jgi:hypothetical protein